MVTSADLGRAVRRLRRERCLSIEALAFVSDIHPTYLGGIERGVRNPSWGKIASLAVAREVSVSTLVLAAEQEAEVARIVREARARIVPESG